MNQRRYLPITIAVLATLLLQLYLCYFFSFGTVIPMTNDMTPANYGQSRFLFPPRGTFVNDAWLGFMGYSPALTPITLLAHLPVWLFFSITYPLGAALAVLTFYLFLRKLDFPVPTAILGGIIYGWQGPLLSNIYSGHFMPPAMLAMAPLAMWCSVRAARGKGWPVALLAGALVGTLISLSQDQGSLIALLVGAVFLAMAGRALWRRSGSGFMILAKLSLTVLTAALVAWPALESVFAGAVVGVRQGASEDPKQKWAWATQWSLPPVETIEYLAPGYFGWRSGDPDGPYWGVDGRSEGWEQTHQGFRNFSLNTWSLGTVATILCCLGFVWVFWTRRRTPGETVLPADDRLFFGRFFAGAALVYLLLAFGKFAPFYQFFYRLPYMSTWRNPVKFLIPGNFCLATVAVYGAHWLLSRQAGESSVPLPTRTGRRALLAVIGFLVIVWVGSALTEESRTRSLTQQGYSPSEIQSALNTQSTALLVALVLSAAVWGALRLLEASGEKCDGFAKKSVATSASEWTPLAWRSRLPDSAKPAKRSSPAPVPSFQNAWALPGLLAFLVIGQMYWVQGHYLEPFNFHKAYATNPMLDTLRHQPEPVRVKFLSNDPLLHYYLSTVFPYYKIASIDIPAASRTPNDYALFFEALQNHPWRLWELAGVKYLALTAPQARSLLQTPGLREHLAGATFYRASGDRIDNVTLDTETDPKQSTHALVELKSYWPKAVLVPGLEIVADENALGKRLGAPDWDPRQSVLVTREMAGSAGLKDIVPARDRPGTVHLTYYGEDRIEVEGDAPAGGYLVINDHFEPLWHVRVNGQERPVFPADLVLRGVALPPGRSRVEFRLEVPVRAYDVSLATWAIVLLLLLPVRDPVPRLTVRFSQ